MSNNPFQFNFGSIGNDIDTMLAEMEARAAAFMSQTGAGALTLANRSCNAALPISGNSLHLDVCETENEIIVVSDLPGVSKEEVSVKLLDPETLLIKTEKQEAEDTTGDAGTYHIRERRIGSMQRTIHLPAAVAKDGATATFKNGVMEVVLPKLKKEEVGVDIHIE